MWDASLLEEGGYCRPAHVLADIYYATTAVNIVTDWVTALMLVYPGIAPRNAQELTAQPGPFHCCGTSSWIDRPKCQLRDLWDSAACTYQSPPAPGGSTTAL